MAVDVSFQLEVTDEVALVRAALADLESADIRDEERQMRIRACLDPESGAMNAAAWLLGPEGPVRGLPGVVLGDCGITATYADTARGLDDPDYKGLDESE